MERILLVERDESLRNEALEVLQGYGYEVKGIDSFEASEKLLSDLQNNGLPFNLVVFGWSEAAGRESLIKTLCDEQFLTFPILILANDVTTEILDLLNDRKHVGLLLWHNFRDRVLDTVAKLIRHTTHSRYTKYLSSPLEESIKVLLVDDSQTVRQSYKNLLLTNGYQTETASSVDTGMELAINQHFDIAIIDYQMPDATGDELCRHLARDSRTKHMICSVLTASYSDEIVKKCLDSGAIEFMFKSESDELLLARLAAMSRSIHVAKSVENERRRLKGILGSVGDGVFGVDDNFHVTFMNRAAREILGYSEEIDYLDKNPQQLLYQPPKGNKLCNDEDSELLQAHTNGKLLDGWETTFLKKDGKAIFVECSLCQLEIEGKREGSVIAFRDISERKLFEEELRWQANHDPLTKLLNRYYFEKQLDQEVSSRIRNDNEDEISAMLYMDLDRFKYINDTAGHVAGDQLLIEIGHQLLTRLRSSDTLARLGGDEFAFILRDLREHEVPLAAQRFKSIIENMRFEYEGKHYPISASIGCDVISKDCSGPGEVLANADLACHIAKNSGRNLAHVYTAESDDRMAMDLDMGWSSRIRDALGEDKFTLVFQPIVPLNSLSGLNVPREGMVDFSSPWNKLKEDGRKSPVLFEVLLRLSGESGQIFAPDMFLPTAVRFNLMIEIDKWVIAEALKVLAVERGLGRDIHFSINLSGSTIIDKTLSGYIRGLLNKYQISGEYITFEITETSAITNIEAAKRLIVELRNLGCKFALDDFGSGFSSFGHLKHLDIDYVKIDGLFIQGVLSDSMDKAVVQSINEIAHSFGKMTVAEYVDNDEIVSVLEEIGIDFAQGYFISKPKENLGF